MANEKLNWEIVKEEVDLAIKGTKIVQNDNKTGVSYFQGKKRLVKVLKSKRNITLEINTEIDKKFQKLEGMVKISPALAHKKHLGTMKYLYKAMDLKSIPALIANTVENFKKEMEEEEKAQ